MSKIGIASMGAMGSTLAYSLLRCGHEVFYASQGRSDKTIKNATDLGVTDLVDIGKLFSTCDFVFCISRGGSWRGLATEALNSRYAGVYVDFNGLHENDIDDINDMFHDSGVNYVDAALRAWPISEHREIPEKGTEAYENFEPRTMYLTGEKSNLVRELFDDFWVINECQPPSKYVVIDIARIKQIENQPI